VGKVVVGDGTVLVVATPSVVLVGMASIVQVSSMAFPTHSFRTPSASVEVTLPFELTSQMQASQSRRPTAPWRMKTALTTQRALLNGWPQVRQACSSSLQVPVHP
jgi:hypothetical protein